MKDLIENAPKIISEAAKSPLGISALLIMTVSVLVWLLFGESSDIYKVLIFFPVLTLFIIVLHYAHSYKEPHLNDKIAENTDEVVEVELTQLPKISEVKWSDSSEKNSNYILTTIEAQILESLRSKPDVRWTRELIISSSRKPLDFSKGELSIGIDELEKKKYINSNQDGIYHVLDLAILYYRSTMGSNTHEIDEADYWDGT